MDKKNALDDLKKELEQDKELPLRESNLVFGEGDIDASVMFIGEAPGERENELCRPFVGRSGQLLDKLLGEIGWQRSDVYISNIVKRRPPENRDPLPSEIEAYKPYLARQIAILNPKVIATLGRFSMNYFLPEAKISRDHGKIFHHEGRIIYPLFHPAAGLRATAVLNDLRKDFLNLPIVAKGGTPAKEEYKGEVKPSTLKKKEDPPQSKLF